MSMIKIISLVSAFCAVLFLASCAEALPSASLPTPDSIGYIPTASETLSLSLESDAAFVYDVPNECFIYLCGQDEILYPASTTKLLTILYAQTLLASDELVTPTDELSLVHENSTVAYVKSHHTLSAEMLIEGMLLPSGNDAAYALATAAGRKLVCEDVSGVEAVSLFLDGMNGYAASLGLVGSNFTSPDGYFDENHYTTVVDMAIIAREAYNNPTVRKYSSLPSDDVTYASGHTNTWKNTNLCLDPSSEFYSPYVTGLKTGSAGKGNYSLIASAELDDGGVIHEYIIGLFRGEDEHDRYRDVLKIIDTLKKLENAYIRTF